MNERIKAIRKESGLKQAEFAERIGLKPNTVTSYETGLRVPSDTVILSICREFNVSETWLRTGEGEMFRKPSDEIGYYVEELLEYNGKGNPFYDAIIEMVKKYHSMDEVSKRVIEDFIQGIADGVRKKGEN